MVVALVVVALAVSVAGTLVELGDTDSGSTVAIQTAVTEFFEDQGMAEAVYGTARRHPLLLASKRHSCCSRRPDRRLGHVFDHEYGRPLLRVIELHVL